MLKTVSERVRTVGVELSVTEEAREELSKRGYDPVYGARPLRRTVQSEVEDKVAEALLSGVLAAGDTAEAAVEDGKILIRKAA